MFYVTEPSKSLRMGDVVQGFVIAFPKVDTPDNQLIETYSVTLNHPKYAAILTPCCSIENKEVLLAPLKKLKRSFYDNEYFYEDMTRINKMMSPKESMSATKWSSLGDDELRRRFNGDLTSLTYAFKEIFIYDHHGLLEQYDLKHGNNCISCGFYMISFRDITRIECSAITRNIENCPGFKLLEIAATARRDLREKMADYFGRPANEDIELL